MYIVYYTGTIGLVPNALIYISVDFDIPTKVSFTNNAESLVFTFLATIMI